MPRRGLLIWLIILPVLAFLTAGIIRRVAPSIRGNIPGTQIFNQSGGAQTVEFLCLDNTTFSVEFPPQYPTEGVRLTLPSGQTFALNQVQNVAGTVRFSNDQYSFYIQDSEGFVESNEVWVYANCEPQSTIPDPDPSPTVSPNPSPTVSPSPSPTGSPPVSPTPTTTPTPSPVPTSTPNPNPNAILYICQDGRQFQTTYFSEQVELILEGNTYYLSQVPTGSGIRYTDGQIILNMQGNQASIDIDGFPQYVNCIAQSTPNPTPLPSPAPRPPNALW